MGAVIAVRLRSLVRSVLRQTLLDPVREGRLRDEDWPYGLRAVVTTGYVVFAVAGLTVLVSAPLRRRATLLVTGNTSLGLPASTVGLLVLLLSFAVACLWVAAQHGPWWLRLAGLAVALSLMAAWGIRSPSLAGGWTWPLVATAAVLAGLVASLVRGRAPFRWPEVAVAWVLVAAAMLAGLVEGGFGQTFGSNLVPLNLQETAAGLGLLALPAAMVAGAAAAEISVRATVATTRGAQQLLRARGAYALLVVLLTLRLAQVGWQLVHRDPVSQGWNLLLPALVVALMFALVGWSVLRLGRRAEARSAAGQPTGRHPGVAEVGGLGDEPGSIGFGVAAALIAVLLPVQVAAVAVPVLVSFAPGGGGPSWVDDAPQLVGALVDPIRALVGLVLIGLALRAARRGRTNRALVLGCVGVMLVALARRLVLGDRLVGLTDPETLDLLATVLVVVAVGAALVARRLTPARAVAASGVLVLSALFAYRTVLADPLGVLLGFPGAALLLLGLTWDLLTGAGWGNGSSRRFPRPTRVLLVLTNSVLTMTVLAYAALVRDASTTVYLDPYAELGDLVFGTALLAAAVIAVLDAAWRGRPVG
ncbi:hypothetical protein [uncultured Friedmanniella sp.]|uniref:hypothetical protein n=1 Tax=uncultured Friedmanniella sp. TaxID=335381 RepID=UPI0035CAC6ED